MTDPKPAVGAAELLRDLAELGAVILVRRGGVIEYDPEAIALIEQRDKALLEQPDPGAESAVRGWLEKHQAKLATLQSRCDRLAELLGEVCAASDQYLNHNVVDKGAWKHQANRLQKATTAGQEALRDSQGKDGGNGNEG